jgi:uncharacterized protein YoaH (UPF0181 family)
MEQVVARGIRWLDSGAALALVVRGETLARLAEQMRDSHMQEREGVHFEIRAVR